LKNIILTSLLISIVAFYSCKEKVTNPPVTALPEGYQQDVPWPSLADSPWPMNHHDPQNTGRAKISGPVAGLLDWEISNYYTHTGISIGQDSSLFITTSGLAFLHALNNNGSLKWTFNLNAIETSTTPLIDKDNTVYVCALWPGQLFAVNSEGKLKWKYLITKTIATQSVSIGLDGMIYLLAEDELISIKPNGELNWKIANLPLVGGFSYLTFSTKGDFIYLIGTRPALIAIDINKKEIGWEFKNSYDGKDVLVDANDNIYLLAYSDSINANNPTLFSLNKAGKLRWNFNHNNIKLNNYCGNPTMDKNGNFYFAYDTLYSVDYNGQLRWKMAMNGQVESPLISDINNNLFVTVGNNSMFREVRSINVSGSINWSLPIENTQLVGFSAAIGYNSRLYVPSFIGQKIFCIK